MTKQTKAKAWFATVASIGTVLVSFNATRAGICRTFLMPETVDEIRMEMTNLTANVRSMQQDIREMKSRLDRNGLVSVNTNTINDL